MRLRRNGYRHLRPLALAAVLLVSTGCQQMKATTGPSDAPVTAHVRDVVAVDDGDQDISAFCDPVTGNLLYFTQEATNRAISIAVVKDGCPAGGS